MAEKKQPGIQIRNKRASFDYQILQKIEAGIELRGTEVKSIRMGKVNLSEGWVKLVDGEAFLMQIHITPYSHGNIFNHQPDRPRKLLLHKAEIVKLVRAVEAKGMTVLPLRMYIRGQYVKLEIGVGKSKKLHDKRDTTKEREAARDMERAIKGNR